MMTDRSLVYKIGLYRQIDNRLFSLYAKRKSMQTNNKERTHNNIAITFIFKNRTNEKTCICICTCTCRYDFSFCHIGNVTCSRTITIF